VFERVKRDEQLTDGVKEMDTHRVPLGVSFFHPLGISTSLTATYVHQEGDFERLPGHGGTGIEHGSDSFWTVDAVISYRLPQRLGFFAVGVTNLFDENFKFFDIDFKNPAMLPTRTVFSRLTLSF